VGSDEVRRDSVGDAASPGVEQCDLLVELQDAARECAQRQFRDGEQVVSVGWSERRANGEVLPSTQPA
jgi:hypothetical protein